ncbi:MAG: aryl-sulfate sulfotransferase [Bacteroidota bacterium]
MQRKCIFFSLFVFLFVKTSFAQYFPSNDIVLNYTQIAFQYPEIKESTSYSIQLEENELYKINLNKFLVKDNSTICIIKDLNFGKKYKWKVTAYNKNSAVLSESDWHYFSTATSPLIDTTIFKIKVIKNQKSKIDDGIIWYDNLKFAADRNGKPVWFLPNMPEKEKPDASIRDLKLTNSGSVTFIGITDVYDCDLQGNLLWTAPNNGKVSGTKREDYHHDFQKLSNGNYLVLGKSFTKEKSTDANDTTNYTIEHGTIIEYDTAGNVLWFWDSRDYLTKEDVFKKPENAKKYLTSTHMNAFSIDNNNEFIYAGFRDLHRIIKIEKKSKKVVAAFGQIHPNDSISNKSTFFKFQHSATILKNGNIAVLNNNDVKAKKDNVSSVVVFTQTNNKPKVVLDFKLNFDSLTDGKSSKTGNVLELPNGNLLVCEGAINRVFETDYNKNILWDAFMLQYTPQDKKWKPNMQYRTAFSTSLYPFLYSVSKFSYIDRVVSFSLFNEGSNHDMYNICFYENDKLLQSTSCQLNSGAFKSVKQKVPLNSTSLKIVSLNSSITKEIKLK